MENAGGIYCDGKLIEPPSQDPSLKTKSSELGGALNFNQFNVYTSGENRELKTKVQMLQSQTIKLETKDSELIKLKADLGATYILQKQLKKKEDEIRKLHIGSFKYLSQSLAEKLKDQFSIQFDKGVVQNVAEANAILIQLLRAILTHWEQKPVISGMLAAHITFFSNSIWCLYSTNQVAFKKLQKLINVFNEQDYAMRDEEEMSSEEIKYLNDLTEKINKSIPSTPENVFIDEVKRVQAYVIAIHGDNEYERAANICLQGKMFAPTFIKQIQEAFKGMGYSFKGNFKSDVGRTANKIKDFQETNGGDKVGAQLSLQDTIVCSKQFNTASEVEEAFFSFLNGPNGKYIMNVQCKLGSPLRNITFTTGVAMKACGRNFLPLIGEVQLRYGLPQAMESRSHFLQEMCKARDIDMVLTLLGEKALAFQALLE